MRIYKHKYTLEDDERILAIHELPERTEERRAAVKSICDDLNVSDSAIRSRLFVIQVARGIHPPRPPRKHRPRVERERKHYVQMHEPTTPREVVAFDKTKHVPTRRPDWFEHPITLARLMAGR